MLTASPSAPRTKRVTPADRPKPHFAVSSATGSDAERGDGISATVRRALRDAGYAPLRTLAACVDDGVVVLQGEVPSYYLKQIAQSVVLPVPGVRGVRNEVSVCYLT